MIDRCVGCVVRVEQTTGEGDVSGILAAVDSHGVYVMGDIRFPSPDSPFRTGEEIVLLEWRIVERVHISANKVNSGGPA